MDGDGSVLSEFGEAKTLDPMGGTLRDLLERYGDSKSGPGAARDQEAKRPREEDITHPRVKAVVRSYRWEGRGSLQGFHLCTGGPNAIVWL